MAPLPPSTRAPLQPSTARTPSPPRAFRRHPPPQAQTLRIPPKPALPEPVSFRARPHLPPGAELTRPVPLRSRNPPFCTTATCQGCSAGAIGACPRSGRSWSLGEMRPPTSAPHRVVSFGSAITPLSAASTDGEDPAPSSWEWPWEDDENHHAARRRPMRTRGSRSDSSSSSVDWGASALLDRTEAWSGRGARFRDRASLSAPRSHSALAGECGLSNVTPRADGPRPWDMTELSQNSKNFASFGFRKNHDGLQSFADTFSSRHLMRHGSKLPPKSAAADWGMDNGQRRGGGKRRFRFLRKKLSVSALKWATGGA